MDLFCTESKPRGMRTLVGRFCSIGLMMFCTVAFVLIVTGCDDVRKLGIEPGSEVEQLAEESGLLDEIYHHGVDKSGGYVVGRFRIMEKLDDPEFVQFKIAVAFVTGDPPKLQDAFVGLPNVAPEQNLIGDGHMRSTVWDRSKSVDPLSGTITFREFSNGAYFLTNVPSGPAKAWFQLPFDGNKVTQIPLNVEFKVEPGRITRVDLEPSISDLFADL